MRTVFDGRTARATTNKTDDDSLRRVVAASATLARSQPKHPGLLPMPGQQKYAKVARYFAATAAATPRRPRARRRPSVRSLAAKNGQTAAGIFSTGASAMALANSRGLFAAHRQTRAEFSVTMLDKDSSGWAKANSPDLRQLDPEALAAQRQPKGRSLAQSARSRARPLDRDSRARRRPRSGRLPVLRFRGHGDARPAFLLQQAHGQESDGREHHPPRRRHAPAAIRPAVRWRRHAAAESFAGRSAACRKNLVYARATAKKMKAKPTGHGLPLPNDDGEAPFNLVFDGGKTSVEEMVASTDRGILVTRLWYIREVDPYEKVLTGMTRDGSFLVENGRIVSGIRNFRFNQGILEMLSNVEQMGPAVRAAGEESFEMVVPAMKVRNFHFTEVTKF